MRKCDTIINRNSIQPDEVHYLLDETQLYGLHHKRRFLQETRHEWSSTSLLVWDQQRQPLWNKIHTRSQYSYAYIERQGDIQKMWF